MRIANSLPPHSLAVHLHFAITSCHSFAAFVSRFSISDFSCLLLSCYKINLHCGVIHESCDHNKQDDASKDKTRTIQPSADQRYTPPNPMSKKMGTMVVRSQNSNYIKQLRGTTLATQP